MSETTRQIAAELAPKLDELITAYLEDNKSAPYYRLRRFLHDNKVSILRVLEAHAVAQSAIGMGEEK